MSTETEKLFKNVLKELRPLFAANGFRSSSQNFILESPECWVIINFQKSRWSGPIETTFYVNVAATSKRWLDFYGKPAHKVPAYYECDWRWRAEYFASDESIQQWTLRDEGDVRDVFAYLEKLFRDFVIPAAKTMTTELELLNHSGWFEYPQLKARSVILAAIGQMSALQQAIAILIEKFGNADGTRKHLELLRSKYPDAMRSIEL